MLCINLKRFSALCKSTSGGVGRAWLFDREDFNFTQGDADANGNLPAYSAIARRDGATDEGGNMFPVNFTYQEAEYKYTQSKKGTSVKYAHSLEMALADIGQLITQWNLKVDAAGACCGIGVVMQLNSGKIIVLGEKYVNTVAIPEWRIAQDGSTATTGKLYDDENAQTTILAGDYSRSAFEFSGAIDAITDLEDASGS